MLDSAAFAVDEKAYRNTLAFSGMPRLNLTVRDADLSFSEARAHGPELVLPEEDFSRPVQCSGVVRA
jgi:hypothetical protein